MEPDQLLDVERLPAAVGSLVELTDVLLVGGNGDVRVGTPVVDGARVVAEVVEHGRGPKVVVFKYKAKTRYRRKQGHRRGYTRLAIKRILTGREEAAGMAPVAEAEAKPKRPARSDARAPPSMVSSSRSEATISFSLPRFSVSSRLAVW